MEHYSFCRIKKDYKTSELERSTCRNLLRSSNLVLIVQLSVTHSHLLRSASAQPQTASVDTNYSCLMRQPRGSTWVSRDNAQNSLRSDAGQPAENTPSGELPGCRDGQLLCPVSLQNLCFICLHIKRALEQLFLFLL